LNAGTYPRTAKADVRQRQEELSKQIAAASQRHSKVGLGGGGRGPGGVTVYSVGVWSLGSGFWILGSGF